MSSLPADLFGIVNRLAAKIEAAEDDDEEDDEKERDKLIFELIKSRYDDELEKINSMDNKASSLAGFISILVGLVFVSGSFELSVIASNIILSIPYFLGTGLLVYSILFAMLAFRIRTYKIAPDVDVLLKKYTTKEFTEVLRTNAATMKKAVEDMEEKNHDKAEWISLSWYFLMVGIGIIFIFFALYVRHAN